MIALAAATGPSNGTQPAGSKSAVSSVTPKFRTAPRKSSGSEKETSLTAPPGAVMVRQVHSLAPKPPRLAWFDDALASLETFSCDVVGGASRIRTLSLDAIVPRCARLHTRRFQAPPTPTTSLSGARCHTAGANLLRKGWLNGWCMSSPAPMQKDPDRRPLPCAEDPARSPSESFSAGGGGLFRAMPRISDPWPNVGPRGAVQKFGSRIARSARALAFWRN